MTETILKIKDLTKMFGPFDAVSKLNLEIEKGDFVALLGPNGAGKTTTMKMIAGLIKPTYGEVLYNSGEPHGFQDIQKIPAKKLNIGYLIDIPSFYKSVSAIQILRFIGKAQGVPKKKLEKRIELLLKIFSLYKWRDEKVQYYSKGMTQKLGIITALLTDPDVLILDEPQTGIDPKARIEVRKFLSAYNELGKTIVLCTHMIHEVAQICNKIAFINKGKLIAYDTIENLLKTLKINEITIEFLEIIDIKRMDEIIKEITKEIQPFLDSEIDPPIYYDAVQKDLRVYFDGSQEAKAEILKAFTSRFNTEIRITSFSQQRTNMLEQMYDTTIL